MTSKLTMLNRTPEQVSVYMGICHKLPFTVAKKREKNWELTRQTEDAVIKMSANETITPFDIFILISIIKVYQDNVCSIEEEVLNKKKMLRIEIPFDTFLKLYIDNNDKKSVVKSLDRLSDLRIMIYGKDGSVKQQRYLYDFEVSKNKLNVSFVISDNFYKSCTVNPWLINFNKFKSIKSQTGRALFLYLSGNCRNDFYQATFEKWLDMKNDTTRDICDNRKQIKKALQELKAASALNDFYYDINTKKYVLSRKVQKPILKEVEEIVL